MNHLKNKVHEPTQLHIATQGYLNAGLAVAVTVEGARGAHQRVRLKHL